MQKTAIEWVFNPDGTRPGYTWNPITGCLNGCSYCYARKLANGRLKQKYLANVYGLDNDPKISNAEFRKHAEDPFYPRFWTERLEDIKREPLPWFHRGKDLRKGIFVCDMGELFGDWIPQRWQDDIFGIIKLHSQHRFYLLTKQPQNLVKFSPFPENCWVGVTATNRDTYTLAIYHLGRIKAPIKFISFEPLLSKVMDSWFTPAIFPAAFEDKSEAQVMVNKGVNWLILGACTGTLNDLKSLALKYPELTLMPLNKLSGRQWTLQPKREWILDIIAAASVKSIPIFLKNNLSPLLGSDLRQEMPNGLP